jgi:hypothetical protein
MRLYNDYTIHINYVKDGWAIRKGVGLYRNMLSHRPMHAQIMLIHVTQS